MSSLYVDRRGVFLKLEGEALVFYENEQRVGTVPLAPLKRVFLRGDVTLTASLLGALGMAGIGVVILSGRKGDAALLLGRPHNDAARRIAQFRASQDEKFCLGYARDLVTRKVEGQKALLELLMEQRPGSRLPLFRANQTLTTILAQMPGKGNIAGLRGLEGAAANHYFTALEAVIPDSLGFTGRNRRPPRDPFNAVLSLTYTMIHSEAVLSAYGAGLDPFVGFLHGLDFGRESLAADLMEPVRATADAFVLRMFNRNELRAEDFSTTPAGCFLGKAGRVRYYQQYETVAEAVRRALDEEIERLTARLGVSTPAPPAPITLSPTGESSDSDP